MDMEQDGINPMGGTPISTWKRHHESAYQEQKQNEGPRISLVGPALRVNLDGEPIDFLRVVDINHPIEPPPDIAEFFRRQAEAGEKRRSAPAPIALTPNQEAANRMLRSSLFKISKSGHGGYAITGPGQFYQHINNKLLADALYAFLAGDLGDAVEARSELLASFSNAP